ncbi:hypothetical protein AVEN_145445-1 [Araneus ventricosus]|uniref:Uncharacterized protein n=1 Tax=Araneus ventricosus TaxID=182803 RepID=A0A4Y2IF09_ARAVE|nr:hypothetical protein AVEN_145445-1 [Araneus ventricosus]
MVCASRLETACCDVSDEDDDEWAIKKTFDAFSFAKARHFGNHKNMLLLAKRLRKQLNFRRTQHSVIGVQSNVLFQLQNCVKSLNGRKATERLKIFLKRSLER